jgi:hypothetical protein
VGRQRAGYECGVRPEGTSSLAGPEHSGRGGSELGAHRGLEQARRGSELGRWERVRE